MDRLGKTYTPLLLLEIQYRKMQRMDVIQVLFELIIELCKLITGNNLAPAAPRPLSPEMRQEVVKLNKTLDEYKFLCEKQIDSPQELASLISKTREQIRGLEGERQSIYNRNRHKKSDELNAQAVRKTEYRWDADQTDNVLVADLDITTFEIFRRDAVRTERMTRKDLECTKTYLRIAATRLRFV